jgi:hypothetical protein
MQPQREHRYSTTKDFRKPVQCGVAVWRRAVAGISDMVIRFGNVWYAIMSAGYRRIFGQHGTAVISWMCAATGFHVKDNHPARYVGDII